MVGALSKSRACAKETCFYKTCVIVKVKNGPRHMYTCSKEVLVR